MWPTLDTPPCPSFFTFLVRATWSMNHRRPPANPAANEGLQEALFRLLPLSLLLAPPDGGVRQSSTSGVVVVILLV